MGDAEKAAEGATHPPRILGVILAGGAARRMGGGDKGLFEIEGRTLLDRVIDRFAPQLGKRPRGARLER